MKKNNIRFSHSAFSTFRHCEQEFKYSYVDKIEANSDKWKAVKDLGTAIHEGIARVLQVLAEEGSNFPVTSPDKLSQVDVATIEALSKHDELVQKNKVAWDGTPDDDYYVAMALNREAIPKLIAMHIPMMEFGTRYRPAMLSEFITPEDLPLYDDNDLQVGDYTEKDVPLIEYEFEFYNKTDTGVEAPIQGIIDAVLFDKKTGQYVLFDWKVRGRLLDPVAVGQDFQLPLYATILNALSTTDARVSQAVMYQMLKTLPKPAKILKKGNISIAQTASHWDFWWASIPEPQRAKMDESEWYALMVGGGKLRDIESWVSAVEVPITQAVMEEVSVVTDLTIDRIDMAVEIEQWLPSWSAHGCEFCQFKKLCQVRRHGLDEREMVKELYRQRE